MEKAKGRKEEVVTRVDRRLHCWKEKSHWKNIRYDPMIHSGKMHQFGDEREQE